MAAADRSEGLSKSGKQYLNEERPLLNPDTEELGTNDKQLNTVFDSVGYGAFHVFITLVCGMALASDSIEVLCVSFVIPVAEGELHLSDIDKATLDSVIFVGMMIGGLFWGSWADAVGRRTCLVNSLLVNGVSGLLSALMPNFGGFLFFRLLSGIGVGGSLPVVFSYFSEFFSSKKKGPVVIVLASFWMVGQVYTALLAWGLLSNPCLIDAHMGSMPFRSWRVFTMLCTLPAITAALLFIILPESPSWLYITGRYEEAERTLQCVARVNHNCNIFRCKKKHKLSNAFVYLKIEAAGSHSITTSSSYVPISPSDDKSTDTTMSVYSDSRVSIKFKRFCSEFGIKIKMVFKGLCRLFWKVYLRTTVVMLVVAFCLSFGSWGLGLWFPEYFKHLLQNTTANSTSGGCSVVGENCTQLDSTCSKVYFDTMLEAASALPGTVIGIFTIYMVGGRVQIAASMIVSGVSVFFIWWLPPAELTVVVLSCLFSGFTIMGWNAYNVINVEYFGTDVRSTAIGLLSTCARISTIVSTFIFGALQTSNPSLPIFLVSMTLIVGGIMPVFLPLSNDPDQHSLLGKWFRKWMSLMRSKIKKKCTHA